MRITDEQRLENLKQRRQELEKVLATRRNRINDNLRRVRKRLSVRERKRDTQRLIVRGRFYDHVIKRLASNPPDCPAASPKFRAWLNAAFDAFVTRADHRALFDLPPLDKPGTETSPDDPIPGFKPKRLDDGSWGARFAGDTSKLPDELVGSPIVVARASGESWIATVLELRERSDRHVLVRRTDPPATS